MVSTHSTSSSIVSSLQPEVMKHMGSFLGEILLCEIKDKLVKK